MRVVSIALRGAAGGLGIALALAACSDSPTAPASRAAIVPKATFAVGDVQAFAAPIATQLVICKAGDVGGTFNVTSTPAASPGPAPVGGTGGTGNPTIAPLPLAVAVGQCKLAAVDNGDANQQAGDFFTVTETVAAGVTVTKTCYINDGNTTPDTCPSTFFVNTAHGWTVVFTNTAPPVGQPPLFIIIDEDGIDNDNLPTKFKAVHVNDQKANIGLRAMLPVFANPNPFGYPTTFDLWTGQVGDEGWFAPTVILPSWTNAGPFNAATGGGAVNAGILNLLAPGPGLGAPDAKGDRESLLDKIPGVIPLRAEGLKMLEGRTVCALVWDSDISINYGPINGSLKGANLGLAAFIVNSVTQLTGQSSSSLPKVNITTLSSAAAAAACAGPFNLLSPPIPTSSSTPFDVKPGAPG